MAERQITLPSGAEIVVRGMKINEANRLAARTEDRTTQAQTGGPGAPAAVAGHVFNELLQMCTVSIVNPGPCYQNTDLKTFWSKALVADRFHALIQIRLTTYPKLLYTFRFQCETPGDGGCGRPFDVGLNLERDGGDIKYKDLPQASREIFRAGNRFETKIAGHTIVFGLTTGADEEKASAYIKRYPDQPVSAALASRIVEISEIEPLDHMNWLNDMDLSDFILLRDAMEAVDGGIDTTLELRCPHCGHLNFDVQLPFGRAFLMPVSYRR